MQKSKKPKKPLHEYPPLKLTTELFTHTGVDSLRRNGIHCIDDNVALLASGNMVMCVNYTTGDIQSFLGPDEGGIGAICVHPSKKKYVVCEKTQAGPKVRVMEYPAHKQCNVLKNGAVQGFSACSFNEEGNLLATVAMEPDYVITVWNWRDEKIVLRNKAFGSDVFTVGFNPSNEGMLVTSGMGHVKFWTMAETFTGLKLQGAIGKFGRIELSDITGFVSFPDGKVVSGSENGSLLLWEGNHVKCELLRAADKATVAAAAAAKQQAAAPEPELAASVLSSTTGTSAAPPTPAAAGETPLADGEAAEEVPTTRRCHEGLVEVLVLIEKGRIIMSAGHDGYMRYWSMSEIDQAENNGLTLDCEVKMLKEVFIGEGVQVKAVSLSPSMDHWAILDAAGSIRKVPYIGYDTIMSESAVIEPTPAPPLMAFNSGGITAAAASPVDHSIVTGGADGTLRLIDYIGKKELYRLQLDSRVVQITFFPTEVDTTGTLFLAGFANGCIRLVRRTRAGFHVAGAWRPHGDGLIAFALDKDCRQLYSIAADKTAFYFTVRDTAISPVGYCQLPEDPTTVEWDATGAACLVGFKGGNILAIDAPGKDEVNPEESFVFEAKWAGLGFRQKQKPPEKPKKMLPTGEIVEESSSDEDEDEEGDVGPWAVAHIKRLPNDSFIVAMDNAELCYEYKLTTRYTGAMGPPPIPPTGIEPPGRVEEPIRNVSYRDYTALRSFVGPSNTTAIIVCRHSRVLIRPMNKLDNVSHAKQVHDGVDGDICGAYFSFDDSLLVTAGSDGLVVAQRLEDVEPPKDRLAVTSLPLIDLSDQEGADLSIKLSIQAQKDLDDKVRAEEAAMGKKHLILKKIHAVHKEYESLLDANSRATLGQKMTYEEMTLDPQLMELLATEREAMVDEAALDFSWQTAKKETLMKKLRGAFVDHIMLDRFVLHGFENGLAVASMRTPFFTEAQLQRLKELEDLLAAEASEDEGDDEADENEAESDEEGAGLAASFSSSPKNNKSPQGFESGAGNDFRKAADASMGKSVKSQLVKAEERKIERMERKRGLKKLLGRKPNQADEDRDVSREITDANANRGDFQLKNDPNYVIPDELRPTAERKAKQLVLTEHSIIQIRSTFNAELLALRDLKARLCGEINTDVSRIKEIAAKLKVEAVERPVFQMLREEQPEKRFDIDQEGLEKFAIEEEKERKRQETFERAKKGFGADLAQVEEDVDEVDVKEDQRRQSMRGSLRQTSVAHAISSKERVDQEMKYKLESVKPSEMEEEEAAIMREELLHEKVRLERAVANEIQVFDEKVAKLFQERNQLDSELCMADMRVLLLFREFNLLKDFKERDKQLAVELDARKREQREIVEKYKSKFEEVHRLGQTIDRLHKSRITAAADFDAYLKENIGEGDHKYLKTVYERRIKRRRKNMDDDDDDGPTSDEDEEEEEDDTEYIEECPNTLTEDLWDEVLQFRERKLDIDEEVVDAEKTKSQIMAASKELKAQEDDVMKQLKDVDQKIHKFQHEKQQRLNLLETIVVLKLSQIQCLTEDRKLPAKFGNDIVVFTQEGLNGLRNRVHGLADEKITKRSDTDTLSREQQKLHRRKAKRQSEYSDWEAKVFEVQLLKFGQRVDLERLENLAVDRETEELKERLRLEEIKWERELLKQNDKVLVLREDNQQRISENTVLLKDLGSMRAEQHDLEQSLGQSTQKIVAKMTGGSRVATSADRAHLKDLVVAQQLEIDKLKEEIAMLRRKGGNLYTPVVQQVGQDPIRTASQ